jgi:hypothetical protein
MDQLQLLSGMTLSQPKQCSMPSGQPSQKQLAWKRAQHSTLSPCCTLCLSLTKAQLEFMSCHLPMLGPDLLPGGVPPHTTAILQVNTSSF